MSPRKANGPEFGIDVPAGPRGPCLLQPAEDGQHLEPFPFAQSIGPGRVVGDGVTDDVTLRLAQPGRGASNLVDRRVVQRRNVRMMRAGASFNPRPKRLFGLLQTFHDAYLTQFTRLDNQLVESRDFYLTLFDWHFKNGDAVHGLFDFNPIYERLFTPFTISPGVVLQPGEYRFTRWKHVANTASRRMFQLNLNVSYGDYWSGKAEQYQVTFTYKLPPRSIAQVSTNQTHARLPEGNFIARIFSSTINYSATPFVSFSSLLQYDNLSRNLGWQSRVRWTVQPGNDLFLIFNQGWTQDPIERDRFTSADSRVSAKFQYTTRF